MTVAAKSHWRLAFRAVKKAFKVSLQDVTQSYKSYRYRQNIHDELNDKRRFYIRLEDAVGCSKVPKGQAKVPEGTGKSGRWRYD